MSDRQAPHPDHNPSWLEPFEEMANDQLEDGSSCAQVHPIIARWFHTLLAGDPPESRDSIAQAMSCLATEIMNSTPEEVIDPLLNHVDEDEVALWIEQILLVGRAFEMALRKGDLDDL